MEAHKHFHMLQNKEVDELYINLGLRAFSFGLVSIFIPLFLLNLGYSLFEVFLFFTFNSVFHITALFLGAYFASKVGLKHTIIISQPFLLVFFILLYFLEFYPIPLILISFFAGTYSGMFWVAFHSDFAENSDQGSKGKEVALGSIIVSIASAFAPVIGGILIVYLNFSYLLVFVALIILASIVLLLLTKDKKEPMDFSLKHIFAKRNKHHTIAYFGYGLYARGFALFWPLILFSILGNYVALGLITTFLLIFSFIATVLFGSFFDKKKKNFIAGSIFIGGIIWIVRLFVSTTIIAFIVDSLYGFVKPSAEISIDATSYSNAGKNAVDYTIYRETVIHTGILICMGIVLMFPVPQLGIIIAAIGSFLMILFLK
jgi:MFS family permease